MIVLFGSTSVIGNAVVDGLQNRLGDCDVVAVGRNGNSSDRVVMTRKEFQDFYESHEFVPPVRAVVLSVGTKLREPDLPIVKTHQKTFEINVIKQARLLESFLLNSSALSPTGTEIHLVSSILSEFRRKDFPAYSLSKQWVEVIISEILERVGMESSLFIWRCSYVVSPLHASEIPGRNTRKGLSPLEIARAVERIHYPGSHYIPKRVWLPTKVFKHFPRIATWVERRWLR